MLRYVFGITLLALGIIVIRALSNGKILRKHQYAFWIIIPIYMILMPFVKIDVPVADIWNNLFTSKIETVTNESTVNISPAVVVEDKKTEQAVHDDQSASDHKTQNTPELINKHEKKPEKHAVVSNEKTNESGKINIILRECSMLVSAILIAALVAYNTGFIIYCRRHRKYIGRDPLCGLKIYSIGHKETPLDRKSVV